MQGEYDFLDEELELDQDELDKIKFEELWHGLSDYIRSQKAAENMHKQYAAGTLNWVTRDNKEILVQDMEQQHLWNTTKLLARTRKGMKTNPVFQAWLTILNKELRTRKKQNNNGT